jgi:hypothetical protein
VNYQILEGKTRLKLIPRLGIHRLYQRGDATLYNLKVTCQIKGKLYLREVTLLQGASGSCHKGLHYRIAFIDVSFMLITNTSLCPLEYQGMG